MPVFCQRYLIESHRYIYLLIPINPPLIWVIFVLWQFCLFMYVCMYVYGSLTLCVYVCFSSHNFACLSTLKVGIYSHVSGINTIHLMGGRFVFYFLESYGHMHFFPSRALYHKFSLRNLFRLLKNKLSVIASNSWFVWDYHWSIKCNLEPHYDYYSISFTKYGDLLILKFKVFIR